MRREEREATEAVVLGDCEAVRRICRNAEKVQLALSGPEAEIVWGESAESVIGAIEWRSEESDAEINDSAMSAHKQHSEELETATESIEWIEEPEESETDAAIKESATSAQEQCPEESTEIITEDIKWFEEPEES
jgi:hypothetical protein